MDYCMKLRDDLLENILMLVAVKQKFSLSVMISAQEKPGVLHSAGFSMNVLEICYANFVELTHDKCDLSQKNINLKLINYFT